METLDIRWFWYVGIVTIVRDVLWLMKLWAGMFQVVERIQVESLIDGLVFV